MIFFLLPALVGSECSDECFMAMFSDSCSLECNTKACYFSFGLCFGCALGCVDEIKSDNECNIPCFNPACLWDAYQCLGSCNDLCSQKMIGDGNCDPECFTEDCNYDGGDCPSQCNSKCPITFLENGECDSVCLTESCGYDAQDCLNEVYVSQGSSGIGSNESPYGSINDALNSVSSGYYKINISPGVYYINSPIIIDCSCAIAIQGANGVEIRVNISTSPFSITNAISLQVKNIKFDGSEQWETGCDQDLCKFIYQWYCKDETSCVNSKGEVVSPTSSYVVDIWKNCLRDPITLFSLNTVQEAAFIEISVENFDYFGGLVFSIEGSVSLRNFTIKHSVLTSSIVKAKTSDWDVKKHYLSLSSVKHLFYMRLPEFVVKLDGVVLEDINRMDFPSMDNLCGTFQDSGLVNTLGIDNVVANDIRIVDMYHQSSLGNLTGFINLIGATNFSITNINISRMLSFSKKFFSIDYVPNFLSLNRSAGIIKNIRVDNLYLDKNFMEILYQIIASPIDITEIIISNSSFRDSEVFKFSSSIKPMTEISYITTSGSLMTIKLLNITTQRFYLKNIDLRVPLFMLQFSYLNTFSDINLFKISDNKEPFLLTEVENFFHKFKDLKVNDNRSGCLFNMSNSGIVTITQLEVQDSSFTQPILLITESVDKFIISSVNLTNSASTSILDITSNKNTTIKLKDFKVRSSYFATASIKATDNKFTEIRNFLVEKINSTAILSTSSFLSLYDSIFQDNSIVGNLLHIQPLSASSVLLVSNCSFKNNYAAKSVDCFIDSPLPSAFEIYITNTIFSGASAQGPVSFSFSDSSAIKSIEFNNVTIENLTSVNCNFYSDKGLFYFYLASGLVTFKNSVFKTNQKLFNTATYPVVYHNSLVSDKISFINCEISNSNNDIFILQNNLFIKQKVLFSGVKFAHNSGSLLVGMNVNIEVYSSSFIENTSNNSLIGLRQDSITVIADTLFTKNKGLGQVMMLSAIFSELFEIRNVSIFDNYYTDSVLIMLQLTKANISQIYYKGNSAFCAIDSTFSQLVIDQLKIEKELCVNCIALKNSNFSLSSAEISSIRGFLDISDSTAIITLLSLAKISDNIISSTRNVIQVTDLTVNNSTGKFTHLDDRISLSRAYFYNFSMPLELSKSSLSAELVNFTITAGLSFLDLTSANISSSFFSSSPSAIMSVSSVVNIRNSRFLKHSDSAIKAQLSSFTIASTEFSSNTAARGGAILMISSNLSIYSSILQNNVATISGGGIYVETSRFYEENTTYISNSAIYGDNIASPPATLTKDASNNYSTVSGSYLKNMTFILKDSFNQTVLSDNLSVIQINAIDNITQLKGSEKIISKLGKFMLDDLIINHPPGSSANFSINYIDLNLSAMEFTINVRKCYSGEVKLYDNSCKMCENNTYSLVSSDEFCKACPAEAVCLGGNKIYPAEGYWREEEFLDKLYKCLNADACLRGREESVSNCKYSYKGNLCAECIEGYKLKGSYICSKCPEIWVSWTVIVISSVMILGLIYFLVYSNIKNLNKEKGDLALLLKILVNYCQTIMLFATIDLKWPESLLYLLDFSRIIGDSSKEVMNLSCSSVNRSYNQSLSDIGITVMLPLALSGFSFLVWLMVSIKKRSMIYIKVHFISTLVVIIFLLHTSICNSLLSLLGCIQINGKYWNLTDLSLECFTGEHLRAIMYIGIPGMVVWCLAIPLIIFYIMFRNRNLLDDHSNKIKYKTLFGGYSPKYYFWEFLLIARKFFIRLIAVILISSGNTVQGLGILVILILALAAHLKCNPYEKDSINRLEFVCVITLTLYVIGGVLFTTNINYSSKLIIGWLLFLMNLLFLLYWAKFFLHAIFEMIGKNATFARIRARFIKSKVHAGEEVRRAEITGKSNFEIDLNFPDKSLEMLFPDNPNNSCQEIEILPRVEAWTVRFNQH